MTNKELKEEIEKRCKPSMMKGTHGDEMFVDEQIQEATDTILTLFESEKVRFAEHILYKLTMACETSEPVNSLVDSMTLKEIAEVFANELKSKEK